MGRPGGDPLPDDDVIRREREALELRRAGVTYDAIAERLGFTNRSAAHKAVKRGLRRTLQEPADELRALELDRLERLQVAVWAKAMRGDLPAVDRALRISERRSVLMGLDLPTQSELDRAAAIRELAEAQHAAIAGLIQAALADLGVDASDRRVLQVVATRIRALAGSGDDGDGEAA